MIRRKAWKGPVRPAHWQVSDTYRVSPRRVLDTGKEFKVAGRRGVWFHFVAHVINPDKPAEWIDAIGEDGWHAFDPSKITQIRKVQTR